jgi:pimeloyl-ACP methyl ester carboxylesterase
MVNPRIYGNAPYSVVLVHGGPGAAGEMKPVAEELSKRVGIVEPLQTKNSINAQVEELKSLIEGNAGTPVTLIGWSWGAWLSTIFVARHPQLVKKLILISSAPFEEKYVKSIMENRMSRLSETDKKLFDEIIDELNTEGEDNDLLGKLGSLMNKAEYFDELPHKQDEVILDSDIYKSIWEEASALRAAGKLIEYFVKKIDCPVVAIHGDYDPHPYLGVKEPLESTLKDFKFILLKNCGHHPWYEKKAREKFFELLFNEI